MLPCPRYVQPLTLLLNLYRKCTPQILAVNLGMSVLGSAHSDGANTPDHLHHMGSMGLGLGTSAVGTPGFGQFPSQMPAGFSTSAGHQPQLGSSLFSHTAGGAGHGSYHPFGSIGQPSAGLQNAGGSSGVAAADKTNALLLPSYMNGRYAVLCRAVHLLLCSGCAVLHAAPH